MFTLALKYRVKFALPRVFAALLAAISLAGCGDKKDSDGSAGENQISIYTMQLKPQFTEYMEGVFKRFEAQNPAVKVSWLDYPAQDYETKLLSLIVAGKGPDVLNLSFEYMVNLRNRDLLLPLTDKLSAAQKTQYLDAILSSACTVKGELCALPWYQSTAVMMCNKRLFEQAGLDPVKPPKSLAELFAVSRQIKAKTGQFGFMMTFSEEGQLKLALAQEGIALVDETMKRAVFNTPKAVELVKEFKRLFDEGVIPRESVTSNHRRAIDLYKGGKTAVLRSGPQFLHLVKNEAPDIYAATVVGSEIPVGDTGNYDVVTQNLSVYAKSKYPKEALDLALFVTNAENQLAFSKLVTIFPSVKTALRDPYFAKPGNTAEDAARNLAAKQLETATVIIPPLPHLPELNKVMSDTMQQVLLKDKPAEQALAEAEAKWTEILSK